MSKNAFLQFRKVILRLCAFSYVFLSSFYSNGQTPPPPPKMYVPMALCANRISWFAANKYHRIDSVARDMGAKSHENSFLEYDANEFKNMLDYFSRLTGFAGVRVYFVSYSDEGSFMVPHGEGNLMTLIFVPTTTADNITYTDMLNSYYWIAPNGKFDSVKCNLDIHTVRQWISNYQNNKLPALYAATGKNYDTKNICYSKDLIVGLSNEIAYQKVAGVKNKIQGIGAYFASYVDTETVYPAKLSMIDFEFTGITSNNTIFLEQTDTWSQRVASASVTVHSQKNITRITKQLLQGQLSVPNFFSFDLNQLAPIYNGIYQITLDTGNPCPPPSSSCPGATLP